MQRIRRTAARRCEQNTQIFRQWSRRLAGRLGGLDALDTLFTVGIDVNDAGRKVLNDLSRPFKGRCLDLANLRFEEMFLWLSGSLARVSQSAPGEQVQLDNPGIESDPYDGWVL